MKSQIWLAGALFVFGLGTGVCADDQYSAAGGACTAPNYSCPQCQDECETGAHGFKRLFECKDVLGAGSLCASWERHWRRCLQRHKGLQRPECPPFCDPNFGYYPTCWRKFPPICRPCPPANCAPGYAPPAPGSSMSRTTQTERSREPIFHLRRPGENFAQPHEQIWQLTRNAQGR